MFRVTTRGDLPDDYEQRDHRTSVHAWNDYAGRILDLEINGFTRDAEEAIEYGRRWTASLSRGAERITITIERTA
jgi:hypothetical protein